MAKGKLKESRLLGGWKKKQWFTVLSPKIFNERPVGETPAFIPDKIIGRTISTNLMTVTGNIRKQNMKVVFEIDKVAGNNAHTFLKSYSVIPAFIKRVVRRGRNRMDEVIRCTTSDKKTIVIKLFLVTSNLAKSGQLKMIRYQAKKHTIEYASKIAFEPLMLDIISGKFQKEMKISLKKIVPLKSVEVRFAGLVKANRPNTTLKPLDVKVEEEKTEAPVEEKAEEEELKKKEPVEEKKTEVPVEEKAEEEGKPEVSVEEEVKKEELKKKEPVEEKPKEAVAEE